MLKIIPEKQSKFLEMWENLSIKDKQNALSLATSYSAFRKIYRNDLKSFVIECFTWNEKKGLTPSNDQLLIFDLFKTKNRVSVRALHGVGKTALAALMVLWFSLTRDVDSDWKVITTASSWRQLEKYLWPEIHKWIKLLRWNKIGIKPWRRGYDFLALSIRLKTGQAFAVASDNHAYIEGAHADSILYIFDESKAIPNETWDAAEGAFSTAGSDDRSGREALLLSISTPGDPSGRFYDIQTRKPGYLDWSVFHMTLENALNQKRVSREWVDNRRLQWGETSAIYQNRVMGEFAQSDVDSVIPLNQIEAAVRRWHPKNALAKDIEQYGFDPARFGGDKSVLYGRIGMCLSLPARWSKKDTMYSAGKVIYYIAGKKKVKVLVDVIGIGAGVYDRLKEKSINVYPFNAANKTDKKDKSREFSFINKRSAGWWMMRELFEEGEIAIPDDELLIGDLSAPKWSVTSSGKIKVESKEDIKKRIGRSTDDADAAIMAFWTNKMPGISV